MERTGAVPRPRRWSTTGRRGLGVAVVGAVVVLVVAAGVVVAQLGRPEPVSGPSAAPSWPQPSAAGYEHRVTLRRSQVLQPDGRLRVDDARRESWTTPDGWAWVRSTGTTPADLILEPDAEWRAIRAVEPTPAAVLAALDVQVGTGMPSSVRSRFRFVLVSEFLTTERLTTEDVPPAHRRAMIAALRLDPAVADSTERTDPLGRRSQVHLMLTVPGETRSIFLDDEWRLLAVTGEQLGTSNRDTVVVAERDRVERIPDDLIAAVGWRRSARGVAR